MTAAIHYGDFAYYIRPRFEDGITPLLGCLLQAQCQIYLAVSSWRLSQLGPLSTNQVRTKRTLRIIAAIVVGFLILVAVGGGIAVGL